MLIPHLGYGGAEASFIRLANFLSQHHDVTIVVFARHYPMNGYAHHAGVEPLAPVLALDESIGKRMKITRWFERWRRFRAIKSKHDIAISFLSGTNLLNALAVSSTQTVVSERGSKLHNTAQSSLQRLLWTRILDQLTYRMSDKIVSVSRGLSTELASACCELDRAKLVTVEGYVDWTSLVEAVDLPIEPELTMLADEPLAVCCGRLHPQKGFQYLIPIFARVKTHVPTGRLLILGDGPELQPLTELTHSVGLRPSHGIEDVSSADVIFLGYRDNPIRYFRLAKVFILSSLYEGLPNALIEAVASGIPCLAADCPWGPRSVLSLQELPETGLSLPLDLDFGLLLPPIQAPDAQHTWVEEIAARLLSNKKRSTAVHLQKDGIRRFDINETGAKWLSLIEQS